MIGTQILLTFYIQNVRQLTALETGLVLLMGALVMGIMSPITGKVFDKVGGKGLALVGFTCILLGSSVLIGLSMNTSLWLLALLFTTISFGISMIMMPLTTAGMNALPLALMAHGTAMNSTLRMVGGALVTALLVTIMSTVTTLQLEMGTANAMLNGIRSAFFATTILSMIGLILSFLLEKKNAS